MEAKVRTLARARSVRLATLVACALALGGCAAGYTLVQPGAAGSGSYYTSEGPYGGAGYYDGYGAGYGGIAGYYPGFGYGYGSPYTFNLGFWGGWGYPGYFNPFWYSGFYPAGGCWTWGCGVHGWRGHHRRHDDRTADGSAPRAWLGPDHAPVPPLARGGTRPIAVPERPVEMSMNRRALESARFAPHTGAGVRVGAPVAAPRAVDVPERPVFEPRRLEAAPRFERPMAPPASIRMPPAPRSFTPPPPPPPVFRPSAPVRHDH